jgi:hypothetical protein
MPSNRIARSFSVLREFLGLSYHRYSHPWRGPIRDMLWR